MILHVFPKSDKSGADGSGGGCEVIVRFQLSCQLEIGVPYCPKGKRIHVNHLPIAHIPIAIIMWFLQQTDILPILRFKREHFFFTFFHIYKHIYEQKAINMRCI